MLQRCLQFKYLCTLSRCLLTVTLHVPAVLSADVQTRNFQCLQAADARDRYAAAQDVSLITTIGVCCLDECDDVT
jgi:hypothetical protein